MGDKSNILDSKDSQTDFSEFDRKRIESVGEDTEYGDETQSLLAMEERSSYSQIPFGFQSRGSYKHASKNCEIVGGTKNSLIFSNFNDKFASPALVWRVIISFLPPCVFPFPAHASPPVPLVSRINDLLQRVAKTWSIIKFCTFRLWIHLILYKLWSTVHAYLCTSWPFNYLFVLFIIFLVTHNSRFRQFVFLDSRGITSWSYESVYNTGTPL